MFGEGTAAAAEEAGRRRTATERGTACDGTRDGAVETRRGKDGRDEGRSEKSLGCRTAMRKDMGGEEPCWQAEWVLLCSRGGP